MKPSICLVRVVISVLFAALAVSAFQPACAASVSDDQMALELGRKVLAVRHAIQNPGESNSMQAIADLGRDQRFYVMVRGWLSYQLEGDLSIVNAAKEHTPNTVTERIEFLNEAIRAIDLE